MITNYDRAISASLAAVSSGLFMGASLVEYVKTSQGHGAYGAVVFLGFMSLAFGVIWVGVVRALNHYERDPDGPLAKMLEDEDDGSDSGF